MTDKAKEIMVFSGISNPDLSQEIGGYLGVQLGDVELSRFSNGEIYVRYKENIRGADVFLIQTFSPPVNDNIMELLVMIDAAKRASAGRISAVVPHYGYSRQDKKAAAREPITAKLIADLLSVAGINRMITMDLHAGQVQGFFDVPVDHMTAIPILAGYFKEKRLPDLVVISPDVGRVKMAKEYADRLEADMAILHKSRPGHSVAEITHVIGKVKGRIALIIDDMIDTGGTMISGAEALVESGAEEVYSCATHGIFSPPAVDRFEKSSIKEVVVTNTLPLPEDKKIDKFTILSVAELLAKTIRNVHEGRSVSALFRGYNHA